MVIWMVLEPLVAGAAGNYVHRTSDPAYVDENGALVQDPYGVGEGYRAANEGNHVVYIGPLPNDSWDQVALDGWPYDRTRALLKVRFPVGMPGRYHFDHDAAAQLLALGMPVQALDRIWMIGDGYPSLSRTVAE